MTPYYTDRFCAIHCGDMREVLAGMDEASFTACVTDPPYHLTNRVPDMPMCADCGNRSNSSFQKQGHHRSCPQCGSSNIQRVRALAGFMGKEWDGGGIAFDPETWRAILRVLKPGGILLAFGGTRTYHRMACAVEDAGFKVRDCLIWLHGQGFPKSKDVSKAIDESKGAKRKTVGVSTTMNPKKRTSTRAMNKRLLHPEYGDHAPLTAPATPEAALWTGYGSALKPAWEPIILAMKPLEGGYARNALAHGVAGINVDGGRIGVAEGDRKVGGFGAGKVGFGGGDARGVKWTERHDGRWPANVLISHDPRCVRVGEQRVKPGKPDGKQNTEESTTNIYGWAKGGIYKSGAHYGEEQVEVYACVLGCPVRMLDEQSGVSTSPQIYKRNADSGNKTAYSHGIGEDAGAISQNFGDTGGASRFFYCAKASTHERNEGQSKPNRHPTVKPLDLITYLLKLVTMPEGTRILDPFMGSGTTLKAAKELGIRAVGIDMEEEYCASSAERLSQEVLW